MDIDPAGRAAMEYVEANIEQANGGIKRKIARDLQVSLSLRVLSFHVPPFIQSESPASQVESPRKIRVLDLNLKFSILDKLDNLSKGNSTEAYAVPEKCKVSRFPFSRVFGFRN